MSESFVWKSLLEEARSVASRERILSKILTEYVLERDSLADALSWRLSSRLAKGSVPETDLRELFRECHLGSDELMEAVDCDFKAVRERDPACDDFLSPFLYFKGISGLVGLSIRTLFVEEGSRISPLPAKPDFRRLFG